MCKGKIWLIKNPILYFWFLNQCIWIIFLLPIFPILNLLVCPRWLPYSQSLSHTILHSSRWLSRTNQAFPNLRVSSSSSIPTSCILSPSPRLHSAILEVKIGHSSVYLCNGTPLYALLSRIWCITGFMRLKVGERGPAAFWPWNLTQRPEAESTVEVSDSSHSGMVEVSTWWRCEGLEGAEVAKRGWQKKALERELKSDLCLEVWGEERGGVTPLVPRRFFSTTAWAFIVVDCNNFLSGFENQLGNASSWAISVWWSCFMKSMLMAKLFLIISVTLLYLGALKSLTPSSMVPSWHVWMLVRAVLSHVCASTEEQFWFPWKHSRVRLRWKMVFP